MFVVIPSVMDAEEITLIIIKADLVNTSVNTLSKIDVDWTYKDLMRNIDDYKMKIIFVEGRIFNSQPDMNNVAMCMNETNTNCDVIFIWTKTNYLVDDYVKGYVSPLLLSENVKGDFLPYTVAVNMKCTNC